MGQREEILIEYDCDLCGDTINLKHPHSVPIKGNKKYLCNECLNNIIQSIGKEDIQYYFKDDN